MSAYGADVSTADLSTGTYHLEGVDRFLTWARGAAIPVGADTSGDAGIERLLDLWSDASVIGLGEATHGTSEFFTIKGRIAEALARRSDRAALAFEAGVAESLALDEAVQGRVSAETAVSGIRFWTWDTVEVRDLLRRLSEAYSAGHRMPVVGIDPQFGASTARALVRRLRSGADGLLLPGTGDLTDDYVAENFRTLAGDLSDRVERCGRSWVDAARAGVGDEDTLRLAAALEAWLDMVHRPVADDRRRVRDRAMAEAVVSIATRRSPIAVWAHNQHVAVDGFGGRLASLGGHLREAMGARYLAVGMSFGSGTFQAIDDSETLMDHVLGHAPPLTWESLLDEVGPEVFALPSLDAPPDVRRWLDDVRPASRGVGAGFSEERHTWWRPKVDDFDWLVHVRHANAARRTPTGVRIPQQRAGAARQPVDLDGAAPADPWNHRWFLPTTRTIGHHVLAPGGDHVVVRRDGTGHDFGYGLLGQEVELSSALRHATIEVTVDAVAPAPLVGCTVRAVAETWGHDARSVIAVSEAHDREAVATLTTRLALGAGATHLRYGIVVTGTSPVVVRAIRCRIVDGR